MPAPGWDANSRLTINARRDPARTCWPGFRADDALLSTDAPARVSLHMALPEPPEKSIFLVAIEIESSAERSSYLDSACAGNAELRMEVDKLLQSHETPPRIIDHLAESIPAIDPPPLSERPGDVIGPYRLLHLIGEGGMGAVYEAEQNHPVHRKVALKVIKPGMDSRQVIARFEAEQQALAILDHPNIAKVLAAGTTDFGRPYFVMELVDGLPITDFCDRAQLTPHQRLELFVSVCNAVQHAHQKGIIHRDLKPTNVLIFESDGQPSVKVIDFGIAKAISGHLTDKTLFTGLAQAMGTPLYMSPEQAGQNPDIDTRSDIYSLGVLLYELLTGTTPFAKERFQESAYDEIRRIIREVEPPKPSSRLTNSKDTLPSISAQRRMEPAKLTRLVRGELDWIVMKALEKDRNRRYGTANAFAADLKCYLNDEPVQACPPSTAYRLRKFVRRNRGPVLAITAIGILLIAGIITTTWQAWRATSAERQALVQKDHAEANFQLAKDAVDKYLNAVTDHPKLNEQDFFPLRKELLETAVPFYRKLAEERRDDPELEAARGRAYLRLALVLDSLGEKEAALADYESMRAIFAKLAAEYPSVAAYRRELAHSQNNRANSMLALGQIAEAETAYRDALRTKQQLADEFPSEPQYRWEFAKSQSSLGQLLRDVGRLDEAEVAFRTALSIQSQLSPNFSADPERRLQFAGSHNNLGILLKARERFEDAETMHRAAMRIYEQLSVEFPKSAEYRQRLAISHNNFANLMQSQRKHSDAEKAHRAAQSLLQRLVLDFPSVPEYRQDLGMSHHNLASVLSAEKQLDASESSYAEAIAIRERLVADYPNVAKYRVSLGSSYKNLGITLKKKEQPEAALEWLAKAIVTLESAHSKEPRLANVRDELSRAYSARAGAMDTLQRHGEAVKDWDRAIALAEGPTKAQFEQNRLRSFQNLSR